MKNKKITFPFVLTKVELDAEKLKQQLALPEPVVVLPKHLILNRRRLYPNTNQELFADFKANRDRDIYTKPRYDNLISKYDYEFAAKSRELMVQNAREETAFYAKNLQDSLRRKILLANRSGRSSFKATLPTKLDLTLINDYPTNYKEFEHLSELNRDIVGNSYVYDATSQTTLKTDSAFLNELEYEDYFLTNKLMNRAKTAADGKVYYIGSVDLDWTLPNYKKAMRYDGKSQLFEFSKSNKSELKQELEINKGK